MIMAKRWTDKPKLFPEFNDGCFIREDMTKEREKEWVEFCFEAYESDGLKEENFMERVEKVLDNFDVQYDWHKNENSDNYYGLVEFWTDTADQDIPVEFYFDGSAEDFVKEFSEYAERYDVDDEVELYVDMRGENGVPNTVRELLDDCQEAKDTLMEIAKKLQTAIKEEVYVY